MPVKKNSNLSKYSILTTLSVSAFLMSAEGAKAADDAVALNDAATLTPEMQQNTLILAAWATRMGQANGISNEALWKQNKDIHFDYIQVIVQVAVRVGIQLAKQALKKLAKDLLKKLANKVVIASLGFNKTGQTAQAAAKVARELANPAINLEAYNNAAAEVDAARQKTDDSMRKLSDLQSRSKLSTVDAAMAAYKAQLNKLGGQVEAIGTTLDQANQPAAAYSDEDAQQDQALVDQLMSEKAAEDAKSAEEAAASGTSSEGGDVETGVHRGVNMPPQYTPAEWGAFCRKLDAEKAQKDKTEAAAVEFSKLANEKVAELTAAEANPNDQAARAKANDYTALEAAQQNLAKLLQASAEPTQAVLADPIVNGQISTKSGAASEDKAPQAEDKGTDAKSSAGDKGKGPSGKEPKAEDNGTDAKSSAGDKGKGPSGKEPQATDTDKAVQPSADDQGNSPAGKVPQAADPGNPNQPSPTSTDG